MCVLKQGDIMFMNMFLPCVQCFTGDCDNIVSLPAGSFSVLQVRVHHRELSGLQVA